MGRKKKPRNKPTIPKDEFRKVHDKDKAGHPSYIYAKKGNSYEYIGITHSNITKGVKNIKLELNPNPNDTKVAYVKPKTEKASKKSFGNPLKKWFFRTDKDKNQAKAIIDKNKNTSKKKK